MDEWVIGQIYLAFSAPALVGGLSGTLVLESREVFVVAAVAALVLAAAIGVTRLNFSSGVRIERKSRCVKGQRCSTWDRFHRVACSK